MWASQVALVLKNHLPVRDSGSIPGLGRSPGGGHGNPFQDSSLENSWTEEPGGLLVQSHKEVDMTSRLSTHSHRYTDLYESIKSGTIQKT